MKKSTFPLKSLLLYFVLLSSLSVKAQKDSLVAASIYHTTKPLQFGYNQPNGKEVALSLDISQLLTETTYYDNYNYLVYDPVKDPRRLAYNTGLFAGAAVVSFGVLWVLPENISNWDKEEMLEYGLLHRWQDNVRAGPVWDEDDFFLNWIMHPWAGGVYYMSARGSGYNKWESFAYSAFMSTFLWEYGIEAFAEIPSIQDLFITPILGSLIGEQFFRLKGKIIRNERKVLGSRFLGGTSLFLMDPFNHILDGLGYETKNKIQSYSAFAPVDFDFSSGKAIWGMQVLVVF